MQAYRQGNPEGFDMLLSRYQKAIFAFIYRFTQNAAHSEELLQEVFMKVIAAAPTYKAKASFKTWLYTIARRSCIDHARKAKHRRTQAFVETVHEDPQASPDTGLRQKNLQQGIADALAKLSTEQREVFLLREYSGLSFKEIATTIGCSEGTVKSRMRYALLSLRQSLLNFRQSSYPPKELA
ncbi:MAG: sigma-70 family RNA polymerase sigma factor [Myxococcales bacterium]|nr:MAG: sigma-70 family RNA polymerase sigma factor [Myxococcales bacterium]